MTTKKAAAKKTATKAAKKTATKAAKKTAKKAGKKTKAVADDEPIDVNPDAYPLGFLEMASGLVASCERIEASTSTLTFTCRGNKYTVTAKREES